MLKDKALTLFLRSLEHIEFGRFALELPDGRAYQFEGREAGPQAHLRLYDVQVIVNMMVRGDIAFADDYRHAKWDSDNLATLIEWALRNDKALRRYLFGNVVGRVVAKLSYLLKMNTRRGSRKNIHAHYDLGNDFYALWLDDSMTYSSALFKNNHDSLEAAQCHKYDRILEHVGYSPQHILEIGCGWGGFAEHGTEQASHRVRGITISPAQYKYARKRLKDRARQVNIKMEDYRDSKGAYDAIVSIEMFEALGEAYWRTYFKKIKSLLKPKGRAVIQAITIDDAYFADYRRGGDAIRSYIFPGGMLPSPTRFKYEARRAGLRFADTFYFGQSYARTLDEWLLRFNRQERAIRALNFDEPFMRLWRYYLCACSGSFRARRTDVMQAELRHV